MLDSEWDGEAMNMVLAAERSAVELVRLILAAFPGFRDHVVYKARLVHFYKRAQILVGDLWGAYVSCESLAMAGAHTPPLCSEL